MSALYVLLHEQPSLRRVVLKCDLQISQKCLKEWSSRHLVYNDKEAHICRNCNRKTYSSKAGKEAGRLAVESGQFRQFRHAATLPAAREKALETMRQKGKKKFTSKPEEVTYNFLCDQFGQDDIKRFVRLFDGVQQRNVDLYIRSKNIFIEVDGVYWHGLDRPYEDLHEPQRVQFDRDRRLDDYCKATGITLIRVTDLEVNQDVSVITERIKGIC